MKRLPWVLLLLSAICLGRSIAAEDSANLPALQKLADRFWTWRANHAPFTSDDVNRIERPGGTREWSRASIDRRRVDLENFESEWKTIDPMQWPIPNQVDYRLIG